MNKFDWTAGAFFVGVVIGGVISGMLAYYLAMDNCMSKAKVYSPVSNEALSNAEYIGFVHGGQDMIKTLQKAGRCK